MRKVVRPDGVTIEYVLDASGRRVAKKKNGIIERRWLYGSGLLPIAELSADGATITKRFGPGYVVTSPGTQTEGVFRILRDRLGSVRLVVDVQSGAIAEELEYDARGNATLVSGEAEFVPFGYAGGMYDPDTGLVRFGARDYDPATNRWLTRDPIGFAGGQVNLYAYVGNDPVNGADPSGLGQWSCGSTESCIALGTAASGTLVRIADSVAQNPAGAASSVEGFFSCASDVASNIGEGLVSIGEEVGRQIADPALTPTEASIVDKLSKYLLNPNHPVGGPKAKWFQQALGFVQANLNDLAGQIVLDPARAVQTAVTQYGTKLNQVISITGANGRIIDVTFAWTLNNDGIVRLVTAIPTKP